MPETVVSAIPSASEISAPVIRSRRRAQIAPIRSCGVRLWTLRAGEGRSSRGACPSARERRAHLRVVGTLTAAAAAAEVSDQPSSTTRLANSLRLFRLSAALPCSFIWVLLEAWVASTPSLQGGPDETTGSGITPRHGLPGDEIVEEGVEPPRPLQLGHVSGALEDLEARARDQAVVAERRLDRDDMVVEAPEDQGRDLDLGQASAGVVAADRAQRVEEAGALQAGLHLLRQQLGAPPVRGAGEAAARGR